MVETVRLSDGTILEKIPAPDTAIAGGDPLAAGWSGIETAVEGHARETGQRLAIVTPTDRIDFAGLMDRCRELAVRLTDDGQGPVLLQDTLGPAQPIAMLACLLSGRPLVSLEPAWSSLRVRQVLAQMAPATVLLTPAALLDRAVDGVQGERFRKIAFERESGATRRDPPVARHDDVDAFVVFTSGSSGVPKGVVHRLSALQDAAAFEIDEIDLRAGDRMALVSPPSTAAVPPVAMAVLAAGATLVLVEERLAVGTLVDLMRRHRVTHLLCYTGLARAMCLHSDAGAAFADLRVVQLVGDSVTAADCATLRRLLPIGARLCLRYGASESIAMMGWFEDPAVLSAGARRPMGRPLRGAELWLDRAAVDGREGDIGEVYASGPRIARGYWRNDEETRSAFYLDPTDECRRFYKTGDIARRRPDGMFEFLGRADNQIKLRGWRIEPEEIEAAARAGPGVVEAAVVARRDPAGFAEALVLYVVPSAGATVDVEAVFRHLQATLPSYMVPTTIEARWRLPLTATGKIDRLRLQEVDRQLCEASNVRPAMPPGAWPDPLSQRIAAIVAEEIGYDTVDPEHVLREIGCDSLQAVTIALRIEKRFAVDIAPETLLGDERLEVIVSTLVERIRSGGIATPETPVGP